MTEAIRHAAQRGHAARERDRALGGLEVGERIFEARDARLPQALETGCGAEVVTGREPS